MAININSARPISKTFFHSHAQLFNIYLNMCSSYSNYWAGILRYSNDFHRAILTAAVNFNKKESTKILTTSPWETFDAYIKLSIFSGDLINRALCSASKRTAGCAKFELKQYIPAFLKAIFDFDPSILEQVSAEQAKRTSILTETYSKALAEIEPEFGFHFERGNNPLVCQTKRFYLYQIMPSGSKTAVKRDAKPIIILPPYVLGANILGFLPGENRSYAHCFANQGIPTYIRVLKDIDTTEALQVMTGEDDARDTRKFCRTVMQRHGKPITLNGYCQGGFFGLCNILSGELDGLVDAFMTCVAPIDGTLSESLSRFLKKLPPRFNDLAYGTKTLANGNQVVDGRLMGLVYKLKSIDMEYPITAFHRDLMVFSKTGGNCLEIDKTAAALNYWLLTECKDLPLEITKRSLASFNTPISDDGTLPVKLFGRKLNLQRIKEKKIPWLICYGLQDCLVEPESALAPLDYIEVEVTPFPKGHTSIATSWSSPGSDYALHTTFGPAPYHGPVKFHLNLDHNLNKARLKIISNNTKKRKTKLNLENFSKLRN